MPSLVGSEMCIRDIFVIIIEIFIFNIGAYYELVCINREEW